MIFQLLVITIMAAVALICIFLAVVFFGLTFDAIRDGRNKIPGHPMRVIHFRDAWLDAVLVFIFAGACVGLVFGAIEIAGEAW